MLKVLGPRAVVKRLDRKEHKSDVLEIVEFNPEPSNFALVLAVGKIPDVKVGDVVILKRYCGAQTTIDFNEQPTDVVIVTDEDMLAVVENPWRSSK